MSKTNASAHSKKKEPIRIRIQTVDAANHPTIARSLRSELDRFIVSLRRKPNTANVQACRELVSQMEDALNLGSEDLWLPILRARDALLPPTPTPAPAAAPETRDGAQAKRVNVIRIITRFLPPQASRSEDNTELRSRIKQRATDPHEPRRLRALLKQLAYEDRRFEELPLPKAREAMRGAVRDSKGGKPGPMQVAANLSSACEAFDDRDAKKAYEAFRAAQKASAKSESKSVTARRTKSKKKA